MITGSISLDKADMVAARVEVLTSGGQMFAVMRFGTFSLLMSSDAGNHEQAKALDTMAVECMKAALRLRTTPAAVEA